MAPMRPTTRRASGDDARRGRPAIRDFSGGAATYEVDFDVRTVYDFVISLMIEDGAGADLLPEDLRWLRDARASLPPEVVAELDSTFGQGAQGTYRDLAALAVGRLSLRSAADLVAEVETRDARDVVRALVSESLTRDVAVRVDAVLAGDLDALATLEPELPEWSREELLDLLRAPTERIAAMRRILAAWLPRFQEIEPRLERMAERDVAERRTDRASLGPAELIEKTTGGIRWLPEPQVRRIILSPSYLSRPYNYIFQGSDWRLFSYPIADRAVADDDGVAPPPGLVRLYRTLGDPTRLRVLKLLQERDWYLTELAQQLELSKPTMKHHLAQLRSAGLVTVVDEGSLTYYSIRPERLDEAGVELHRYLD